MKNIKFIDLFAGLGGFRVAFEEVSKKLNIKSECVFVSEINKEVIKTYTKNFSESDNHIINIREIDDECLNLPDHDFLFAGFPCQTFSNAGHKKGFLDQVRGTLFFDVAKILKYKKPKYALLENVKHIVNHDKGKTWNIITKTLKDIGYLIPEKPLILNPLSFGIPQDRKRVFIPMVLKTKISKNIKNLEINLSNLENDFFMKKENFTEARELIEKNFLEKSISEKYFLKKSNDHDKYLIKVFDAWNEFIQNVKMDNNRTLPVIWIDFWDKKISNKFLLNLPKWKQKYLIDMSFLYKKNKDFIDSWMKKWDVKKWKTREKKFEWQAGNDIKDIRQTFIQLRQSGIRCRRPTSFPTLVAMVQIPIIYDKKGWRYLTPRETANLQCFPKKYLTYSQISDNKKSDFYSYMQFGNSVNVKLVKLIQEELIKNY